MSSQQQQQRGKVRVGDRAPDFNVPTQSGEHLRLSSLHGSRVAVLYFYPKDETPGCTAEACAFRDSHDEFAEAGAVVLGVSSDSVAAHGRFAAHHGLPFTLLSDEGGALRKLYGVPATLGLLPGRVTYVIDKQGVVQQVFSAQFGARKHITEALRTVRRLVATPSGAPDSPNGG